MSEKRSSVESQKAPNRDCVGDVRHLAVDEVEDVGDDHDDAGQHETVAAERPRGADVDQDADEREDVWDGCRAPRWRDDRAQREHADGSDEAGERHRRLRILRTSVASRLRRSS